MKYTRIASALALLVAGCDAFAPVSSRAGRSAFVTKLRMSEEPKDEVKTVTTKMAREGKELAYDEKTGRFFETGLDEGECIPDDEYCVVDQKTGELVRLTVEEKERIFLDALQSYYVSGRQMLSDSEFDLLREDLSWNGSDMVNMNRNEAKFLEAKSAYLKGEPIITDDEYNKLKADLKEEGSKFAVSTEPKCYIDTGICTVTLQQDKFRNNLLYLPVGGLLSIFWLGIAFELIEPIIRVNPLFLLALGTYPIYQGALKITDNFIFQNNLIVYGPCPSCEVEQRVYFGDILFTEGFNDIAKSKCTNCKTEFTVQRNTLRASTLPKA
mmetsp:Transcript_21707/g.30623  ORF Transcript_21707/g.30623 Transcript_21707/m.30623 type:complete len:326 (+) Transcript_21707:103-1080(+)